MLNLGAHERQNLILNLIIVHERLRTHGKVLRHLKSPLDLGCENKEEENYKSTACSRDGNAYLGGKSRFQHDSIVDDLGFARWAASVHRIGMERDD